MALHERSRLANEAEHIHVRKGETPGRGNNLPWYKVGGRVLYRRSEVEAWLESGRMSGGEGHD